MALAFESCVFIAVCSVLQHCPAPEECVTAAAALVARRTCSSLLHKHVAAYQVSHTHAPI